MRLFIGMLLLLAAPGAAAQDTTAVPSPEGGTPASQLLAVGDARHEALNPPGALAAYTDALLLEPGNHAALWRAARTQVDIAKQIEGDSDSVKAVRDSMYTLAAGFANRAIAADSSGPNGWFALALALGQLSLTRGGSERLEFGKRIYDAAARGLALDSTHSGLHHIMGAWHAEVRRLSGFTRFVAKTLLGAGFLGRASWDSAIVHLERAVALDPDYIFHRVELAEVYADRERWRDARAQLERVARMPATSDVMDPRYQERAARLLDEIRDKGA